MDIVAHSGTRPRQSKIMSIQVRNMASLGSVGALVMIGLVFEWMSGSFLTLGNLMSILEASAVPVILAVGISFVILLGAIDLSVEGVIATSSMTLSLLVLNGENANDYALLGIFAAIATGVLVGAVNGALNAALKMPSLIVTLGTWFIGLGIAALLFPDRVPVIKEPLVLDLSKVHLFGVSLVVYIALLVLLIAHLVLRYTTLGRMIYAIGGDEGVITNSGLPIKRYKLAAFSISGGVAALAGVLLSAQLGNGNADIGNGQLFPAISAAVLGGTILSGGKGGALQSALGAVILEVLNNGLVQIGAGQYSRNIISGAVILLAVGASSWHLRQKMRVVK